VLAAAALPSLPAEVWLLVFEHVSPGSLLSELGPLARVCRAWATMLLHSPPMLRRLSFAGCRYRPDPAGADRLLARCAQGGNVEALFFRGVLACIANGQVRSRPCCVEASAGAFARNYADTHAIVD